MQKFFICERCGSVIGLIENKGAPIMCCGEKMTELIPNFAEASIEKHLPVVTVSGDTVEVKIGEASHPMEESHRITFVYVETERGGQRKSFKVGDEPKLTFKFSDDKPVAVYAYCNIHGLWKTDV